jgi:hypothetical protein
MDAGIINVIDVELYSGPKMANGTCVKSIVTGTIARGSTVLSSQRCVFAVETLQFKKLMELICCGTGDCMVAMLCFVFVLNKLY